MVGRSSSGEPCGSTDCFVLAAVRWLTFAASPMARVDIVGFAFAFSSALCHAGTPAPHNCRPHRRRSTSIPLFHGLKWAQDAVRRTRSEDFSLAAFLALALSSNHASAKAVPI
jgi:hypothetical protein